MLQHETWPIDKLIEYARNPRKNDHAVDRVAAAIREFGFRVPVVAKSDGTVVDGHLRLKAAKKLGLTEVPVVLADDMTDLQIKAFRLSVNKMAELAQWDEDMLKIELEELSELGFDLELTGFTDEEILALGMDDEDAPEDAPAGEAPKGNLSDRFMIPPFTVLNAREGWWQNRKKAWLALGITSSNGRDAKLAYADSAKPPEFYKLRNQMRATNGADPSWDEVIAEASRLGMMSEGVSGTSIFDPVLCEIAYRWFSPVGGLILDPFAGGSVRGIVASKLGRQYIGHELRQEQVDANRIQGGELCGDDAHPPAWICGDSRNIDTTCADVEADMVFSCPPYADLEVYSDDPKDLSTMKYSDFKAVYFEIIKKACDRLKPDSFACFVVGEVRDKKGNYIDFVGDTVQAFRDAGLAYYNEAILITCVGSLPIRAGKQFSSGRKLGKTHQNILVFVKGSGKKAATRCGSVDVDESMFDGIDTVGGDEG